MVETVEAFLRAGLPGDLQVILAYNTPQPMPVEDELRAIAARDPRFVPLRVEGSIVQGAERQRRAGARPRASSSASSTPTTTRRPARSRARGAGCPTAHDVVQGHCVVRNGDANLGHAAWSRSSSRSIYARQPPGPRARCTASASSAAPTATGAPSCCARRACAASMLTEDIDSSLRVVERRPPRSSSDPGLISAELAPTTLERAVEPADALGAGLVRRSRARTCARAALAASCRCARSSASLYLLGWREVYPWLSLQMFPILAYWLTTGEPARSTGSCRCSCSRRCSR